MSATMSSDSQPTVVKVLNCNAADLHRDAHVWDFGSGEHFVCFGDPDADHGLALLASDNGSPTRNARGAVGKPLDMESYEVGYRDGESSAHADWNFALSEVLGDDFDITPTNVARALGARRTT